MQALLTLLLAAALLVALAHGARRAAAGELRVAPETVVPLVLALVVVGLGLGKIGDVSARLKGPAVASTTPPVLGIDDDAIIGAGIDPRFLEFAAANIPHDDHFVVVCAQACDDTQRYLATFRLTPRVPELEIAKADWIVFLGVAPASSRVPATRYTDQRTYGEGLAIARVKRP